MYIKDDDKRTVLGVAGKVIFLSGYDENIFHRGYTQKDLIVEGYTLQQDKEFIKIGQNYFYLNGYGISEITGDNGNLDNKLLARANVYLTKEEAQKADNKRLALGTIQKFIRDNDLEFEPDWQNNSQTKYQITGWNYEEDDVITNYFSFKKTSPFNLIFYSGIDRQKVLENCKEELKTLLS